MAADFIVKIKEKPTPRKNSTTKEHLQQNRCLLLFFFLQYLIDFVCSTVSCKTEKKFLSFFLLTCFFPFDEILHLWKPPIWLFWRMWAGHLSSVSLSCTLQVIRICQKSWGMFILYLFLNHGVFIEIVKEPEIFMEFGTLILSGKL